MYPTQSTIQSFILCTFPRYYIIIYTWRRFHTNNVMQAQTVLHIKTLYIYIFTSKIIHLRLFFVYSHFCHFCITTGCISLVEENLLGYCMAPNTISLKWGNDEFCIWKDSRVSKIATEILNTQIHKFLIKTLLIDKAQTYFFFLQFFVSSLVGFTYLMWFKWHFDLSIIMQKRAIYCQAGEAKISLFHQYIFHTKRSLHSSGLLYMIKSWAYLL